MPGDCYDPGDPTGQPCDALHHGVMRRERAFPFRLFGSLASSGSFKNYLGQIEPIAKWRHTRSDTRCVGFWPPEENRALGEQFIRMSMGQRTGRPAHLVPLTYVLDRHCDHYGEVVLTCNTSKAGSGAWHVDDFSASPRAGKPPWWGTRGLYTSVNPDPLDLASISRHMADSPEMDQYNFGMLWPVPPVEAWGGLPTPYPPDAPNQFFFDEPLSYEIPCYRRLPPFRHIDPESYANPAVPAGQRILLAQSEHPNLAMQPAWTFSQAGNCDRSWMLENFSRRLRGMSGTVRYDWTADPQARGWWVEYVALVTIYFVSNYQYHHSDCVRGQNPDVGGCWWRWNAWYDGEVRAKINGDVNDPDFHDWVASHHSGYGTRFSPLAPTQSRCNDVLKGCLGIDTALGDVSLPSEVDQTDCQNRPGSIGLPCLSAGLGYSTWYVPHPPNLPGLWPSYHGILPGVRQYPETGLIHRTQREVLDKDGNVDHVDEGWAMLAFSTGIPKFGVIGEPGALLNEIQLITIEWPVGAYNKSGGFIIMRFEEDVDAVADIAWNDDAATVKGKLEAASWGPSSVDVLGDPGGPWSIEYIGRFWNRAQPIIFLLTNYLWCNVPPSGDGVSPDVTIARVQEGGSEA